MVVDKDRVKFPKDYFECYSYPFQIKVIDKENILWKNAYRPLFQKIIWIRSGYGKILIGDQLVDIKPFSFYLVNNGNVFQLIENSSIQDGHLICYSKEFLPSRNQSFNEKFYSSFYGYIGDLPFIRLEKDEVNDFQPFIKQLFKEFNRQGIAFGNHVIIQHLLIILITLLERKSREMVSQKVARTKKKDKEIYFAFLKLVDMHYAQQYKIDFYANELGIRRRKLTETIKLFDNNKNPKTIIQEKKILESKRLIAFTNQSFKEIAYQLGLETPNYFSRVFKQYTGMTPLSYLRMSSSSPVT